MKLSYKTKDNRMVVEIEGDTMADLWKGLAEFQEVFEDRTCTKFGESSDDVRFTVRKTEDEDEYFELRCVDKTKPKLLGCKKVFGQLKKPKGALFPVIKKKDEKTGEVKYLPDNGWLKYNKDTKEEE